MLFFSRSIRGINIKDMFQSIGEVTNCRVFFKPFILDFTSYDVVVVVVVAAAAAVVVRLNEISY